MDRDRIRETLADIARREAGVTEPIADDAELAAALDSMQRLSLVVAVEDHYRICFDAEDDARVRTLADLVALIRDKLEERGERDERADHDGGRGAGGDASPRADDTRP